MLLRAGRGRGMGIFGLPPTAAEFSFGGFGGGGKCGFFIEILLAAVGCFGGGVLPFAAAPAGGGRDSGARS